MVYRCPWIACACVSVSIPGLKAVTIGTIAGVIAVFAITIGIAVAVSVITVGVIAVFAVTIGIAVAVATGIVAVFAVAVSVTTVFGVTDPVGVADDRPVRLVQICGKVRGEVCTRQINTYLAKHWYQS